MDFKVMLCDCLNFPPHTSRFIKTNNCKIVLGLEVLLQITVDNKKQTHFKCNVYLIVNSVTWIKCKPVSTVWLAL